MGITVIPREIEDDTSAKFWAVNKVYTGDLKMANSNICWFAADFKGVMLVQRTEAFPSLLGTSLLFDANSVIQKSLSCFVNKHAWQPSLQSMEGVRARLF